MQAGAAILNGPTRAFTLLTEAGTATTVVDEMFTAMDRVARVHPGR